MTGDAYSKITMRERERRRGERESSMRIRHTEREGEMDSYVYKEKYIDKTKRQKKMVIHTIKQTEGNWSVME